MNYYFFQSSFSYCEYMCNNFADKENVYLLKPHKFGNNKFLILLNKIKYKYFKNNYYSKIWYSSFFDFKKINDKKPISFCFFDSCFLVKDIKFLKWLKKKWPSCKIVLLLVNHIGNDNSIVDNYRKNFDYIFSFDQYDSQKYNIKFFNPIAPKINFNELKNIEINKFDIGFISRDKGRYQELKKLYIRLTESGIKCLFYIISNSEPIDEIDKKLLHKEFLDYKSVIELEYQCKCLLDYSCIKNGEQGYSLRILDALNMNKYLITDNKKIIDFIGYDEQFIKIINSLNDVKLDFIGSNKKIEYKNTDVFSGDKLLEEIQKI